MFKNLRIGTKLSIIFVFVVTLSTLIVSFIGFNVAEKSIKSSQITSLTHIAILKADWINTFFRERSSDIKIIQDYYNVKTNFPIITMLATDRANLAYIKAKKMLDDQIKTFPNVNGCYVDFMLVSPEGKVVYSANELHEKIDLDSYLTGVEGKKAFEQGKKGVFFSDIYVSELKDYTYGMLITAPVYNFKGYFTGVIALELDMDYIFKYIQDTTGLGKTGETLIGKKITDGALFLNVLRHDKDSALKRKALFGVRSAFPMMEAVQGRNGADISIDYRGKDIIAAWRHIETFNWGLVAKIDVSEAYAPVNHLKITVLLTTSIFFVIATVISLLYAKSLTRPVKELSDITAKIAHGDLTLRAKVESKDEIGILAISFNKMTESIVDARSRIEQTIADLKLSEKHLVARIKQQAIIADIGLKALATADIKTLMDEIVSLAAKTLDVEFCKILELLPGNKSFLLRAGFGWNSEIVAGRATVSAGSDSQAGYTLISDKPVIVEDMNSETRFNVPTFLLEHGVVSGMSVVIHGKNRPFGVFGAHSTRKRLFNNDDIYFLQAIANIVAEACEHNQLENALISEKEYLGVTLRSIGDGVITTDNKGKIVLLNKVAEDFTGWSQSDAKGKILSEVFSSININSRIAEDNLVDIVLKTRKIVPFSDDKIIKNNKGTEKTVSESAAPLFGQDNEIIGIVIVIRDVTERKRLEEEKDKMKMKMVSASKLASLGEIAAGVAHEINQPLTYISAFIQTAQDDIEENVKINEIKLGKKLKSAYTEVKRINSIVQHLRTFGRQSESNMRHVNIETVFNNTLLLMGERIRLRNIALIKDIEEDLPMVLANSNRLEEVFINLFQNAIDAFNVKSDNSEICFKASLSHDKKFIIISVRDNGAGIEKKTLEKIFEPFFTTKEVGKGTGMGLSIVYGIIQEHKGAITCDSELNIGTTFEVRLPIKYEV